MILSDNETNGHITQYSQDLYVNKERFTLTQKQIDWFKKNKDVF